MTKKADYKGKAPDTIFVVSTPEGFRTYIYEKQAINFLDRSLRAGKKSKLITYVQEQGI